MEYKKDKHSEPQRFIGQHNQDQKNTQSPKGYGYIVRKAEKLTTALYLVTDILSEKEPMKWKMREAGVDILSDITLASTVPLSEKLSVLRIVLKKIDKVVSFLDITASTRMMSEMNASMLRREYSALKDGIESEWSQDQERSKNILTERFFDTRENLTEAKGDFLLHPLMTPALTGVTPIERTNGVSKIIPSVPSEKIIPENNFRTLPVLAHTPRRVESNEVGMKLSGRTESVESVRAVVAPLPKQLPVDREPLFHARSEVTREDRRKIILALIKQKPAITVSDIAKSIPSISEKTIQRELLAMVAENVLIKRGERRWSTYALRDS